MKNSRLRRIFITLGIVLGLALSVLILSIIGQEGNINKTANTNNTINDALSKITVIDDKDCVIVNVYGSGKARYGLTLAILDIYVKNPTPSTEIEKTYNNVVALGNKIIQLLRENDMKIETKSITIQPYYTYVGKFAGYVVTYHITAMTLNISAISNVVPYLVSDLVTLKLSFSANRTVIEKAYDLALRRAIENALSKLNVIARTLGMDKIVILNIRENFYPIMRPTYEISVKSTQPVIYAPTGEITASVYVTAKLCK